MQEREDGTQTIAVKVPTIKAKPAFGVSLSTLLSGLLLFVAIAATGIVAVSSYRSSKVTVDDLWTGLASQASAQVVQFGLRQFEPAVSFAEYSEARVDGGTLDVDDDEQMLRHLEASLDAYPTIIWASFGRADGDYLSVYRWPNNDGSWQVRRTVREIVEPGKVTWFREWTRGADGSWTVSRDARDDFYDPRVKPWMKQPNADPTAEFVWTGPYLFHSRKQTGMIMGKRSTLPITDEYAGVWAAEFEAKPLVDLLAGLELVHGTRVYVVDKDGKIVAHPDRKVRKDGPKPDVLSVGETDDALLQGAWAAYNAGPSKNGEPFRFDDNIAMARSFPAESKLPWTVLVVVRGEDVFAESRAQGRFALIVAIGVVLLALLGGIWFSRGLTTRIDRLLNELLRIARLDLAGDRLSDRISLVRELNEIAWAADTMKAGLQAFSRYTPREVVKEVLQTGGSAELGVVSREVSVMFTDIANFSTIVESTDPDVLLQSLSQFLGLSDAEIFKSLGLRVAFLGDGFMALWGAPTSRPDHALRACECAMALSALSFESAAEAQERGLPVFRTRFGVNSGKALVGNIGAEDRFSYSAVGDMVNAAARMEELNKVYGTNILVGEQTMKSGRDIYTFRRIDRVKARGRYETLDIFELVGRTGDLDGKTLRAINAYESALTHYFNGAFEAAKGCFKDALEQFGGRDGASTLMIRRCRKYIKSPPADWSGVFEQR